MTVDCLCIARGGGWGTNNVRTERIEGSLTVSKVYCRGWGGCYGLKKVATPSDGNFRRAVEDDAVSQFLKYSPWLRLGDK